MRNRLLISVAAIALIAGTGAVNAQGTGGRESGGAAMQGAPSAGGGAAGGTAMPGRESTQPSSGTSAAPSEEKSPEATGKQHAQENTPAQKPKGMTSDNEPKGGKNMKAEGREGRENKMNAEGGEGRNGKMNAENKNGTENRSQVTTGQAGAGAKLSTEQRTRITTVIREQHIAPVTNVNFSISVGTRVPREGVEYHPLPPEVVTYYPEWRGYEFILVRDQIVVIDPETFEIVAVLEA